MDAIEDEFPVYEEDESINSIKRKYLSFFLNDLDCELTDIERTLETEASKILLSWVRDKVSRLHVEYENANLRV